MKQKIWVLVFFLALSSLALSKKRVKEDEITESTLLDGDSSAIVQGCGNQPIAGFTYCRKQEGDPTHQSLGFIAPPSECEREYCAFVKVWNTEGEVVFGEGFKKGQTRVQAPWPQLLSCSTMGPCLFELYHRGFYTFNLQVFWLDEEGHERDSFAQGDIVLRVYRKGYVPLHHVFRDPNYVWEWVDGGYVFKSTSSLRSFVGPSP